MESMSLHEPDELFSTRAGWGIPAPPGGSLTGRGAFESFQEASQRLSEVLVTGLSELAERYAEASEEAMARRHQALSVSVQRLLSGQTAPPAARASATAGMDPARATELPGWRP